SAGLRTVLLERDVLPRHKCCAGGVLGRAQARAGLQLPDELVEQRIRNFAVVWDGHRELFPLSGEVAAIVRRERLDHFLVQRAESAGVEVLEGTTSLRAREEGDNVAVITDRGEMTAGALIVAEGCTSGWHRPFSGLTPDEEWPWAWPLNAISARLLKTR
ncbi:hypothetical protein AOA80_04385, partial [Methanomassiliicoccales archaeon RumEn M1]